MMRRENALKRLKDTETIMLKQQADAAGGGTVAERQEPGHLRKAFCKRNIPARHREPKW